MSKKLERFSAVEKSAITAALNGAFEQVNNEADVVFENLLTQRERLTIGRRILIANLILSGKTQMK